jgi:F0F1-type ATP synthase delta subunit
MRNELADTPRSKSSYRIDGFFMFNLTLQLDVDCSLIGGLKVEEKDSASCLVRC